MIFGTAYVIVSIPVPSYLGVVLYNLYFTSGLVPSWSGSGVMINNTSLYRSGLVLVCI